MNRSTIELDWDRLLGFDRAQVDESKAPVSAAKVGLKETVHRAAASIGRNLDAKVGVKIDVRFGRCLPVSVTAKIGTKDN